jgi:hypothetical protein
MAITLERTDQTSGQGHGPSVGDKDTPRLTHLLFDKCVEPGVSGIKGGPVGTSDHCPGCIVRQTGTELERTGIREVIGDGHSRIRGREYSRFRNLDQSGRRVRLRNF